MALEQAGVQFIAMGGDQYIITLTKATGATNGFVDATESGGGKVSGASQIMVGALRQIGTIAVDAFMQAGKATAGFIKDSVGLAGDFEAGMLNFQAVAGKDVDTAGLAKFRDMFIDIGKRLPVSTTEVQNAATELVKGGIEPATLAAGGLESSIQFASAALKGDLVKAAEISAKVVGGWADVTATAAEKADLMTHAQDQMTKAANASTVDVDELARGVYNAQGVFKTAGGTFDDLTVTLAALSPRFASASEAGNSFKNFMARLQPTTDAATDAMMGLGLITEDGGNKFYDATGKFIGVQKASQLLQDSLKGLNEQQKQSVLQTIFGNDAMGSAAGLANLGAAGYQNMADAMDKANGVAEAAAIKQQGFNTALDNAKGSVEALQITIGSYLLPVLTDLMNNYIAPAVNTLTDLASAVFGDDEAFNRLSPTLQDIVHGIDDVIADTQDIIGAFNEAGGMSSDFAIEIGNLAEDLGLPGNLIEEIVLHTQSLVKWFSSAGDESSDLGSAIDDLSGIWDHASSVVANVMHAYQAIAQAVLPIVTQFVEDHGEEIEAFFKTTWNEIIQIVNLALDVYDSVVPPVLNAIAGFISAHGDEIQKIFGGVWEMITSIVTGALETIKGAIKLVLDVIHGDWNAAWTDIKNIIDAQATAIGGIVSGFLDAVAGIFDTKLDDILQLWEDNWNMAVDIVENVDWGAVGQGVIDGIISGVEGAAGSLFSTLKNLAADALQAAKDALGISSPSTAFMPVGQFAVEGIMKGVTDNWPRLTNLIGSISKDLIDDMTSIGQDMQNAIADGFGATASIDRQIAKNLDSFKDVLPQYQQYTTGALKEAQSQAEAMLDPAEGAKFFQMRSKQILEYAKLQKDLSDEQQAGIDAGNDQAIRSEKLDELKGQLAVATTEDEIAAIQKKIDVTQAAMDADALARQAAIDATERITKQMELINKAQTSEIDEFNANVQGQQSATDKIADSINAVIAAISGIDLTDDQIKFVDMLSTIWGQLQAPAQSRADAYAHPPALPAQQAGWQAGGSSSTSTQNINMPIYTNQTPAALQQSWQIMQASMP